MIKRVVGYRMSQAYTVLPVCCCHKIVLRYHISPNFVQKEKYISRITPKWSDLEGSNAIFKFWKSSARGRSSSAIFKYFFFRGSWFCFSSILFSCHVLSLTTEYIERKAFLFVFCSCSFLDRSQECLTLFFLTIRHFIPIFLFISHFFACLFFKLYSKYPSRQILATEWPPSFYNLVVRVKNAKSIF